MKLKNITLLAVLAIVSLGFIAGCIKDDFKETIGVCPLVISTNPTNLAVGVSIDQVITVTFNEVMNPATITPASFTLQGPSASVAGTVKLAGSTASFTIFGTLMPFTTYTGRVNTSVKDLKGNALQADYVWTFTTGSAVSVIATTPVNLATGVSLSSVISATFRSPMDPSTINEFSFTLMDGTTSVPGVVTYTGNIATFIPNNNLSSSTNYTATISTAARDINGIALSNDYVWTFRTLETSGPVVVDLKSVARFGIISGVGVNSVGFSEIHNMDIGISPGVRTAVTGFPPAILVNGAIFASDDVSPLGVAAMLVLAKQDLTDAYLLAKGATTPAPATIAGDQGGKTLSPGIYKSTSTLLIQSGDLTLDAQGDANAVWIFQIASDFTTVGGAGGNVILRGGAQAKNIFWQTGSSATLGNNTAFKGNILALTSITMNSEASAVGRMLAINGAVVLTGTNIIDKP